MNGITGTDGGRPVNDGLARALGLDKTHWWSATGEAYLQHVSKARPLERVFDLDMQLCPNCGCGVGASMMRTLRAAGKLWLTDDGW